MVEPKIKKWSYFTAFVLPCLILYVVFFIIPFFRGIAISFTNWDGLTPKIPIIVEKNDFESNILGKLEKEEDKKFLLDIFEFQSVDNSYHRISVKGKKKYKLERLFKKAKWEPERYKFVGLENYKKIFTGQVGDNFYPHTTRIEKFTRTSNLPNFISKKEFEREIKKNFHKFPESEKILTSAYTYDAEKDRYKLVKDFDEYLVFDKLWTLPEVTEDKVISETALDNYIRNIKSQSLLENPELDKITDDFVLNNSVRDESLPLFNQVNESLVKIGEVKKSLSDVWVINQKNMGVIGFTLFFALFSVIGINVVALPWLWLWTQE